MIKMNPKSTSSPQTKQWSLVTNKHYKIWFSHNPNEFLSTENQIRCIRFKLTNPKTSLSLVYSAKILSAAALKSLSEFSAKMDIRLIDFDSDLPAMLKHEYDKYIYSIAKAEIQNAVNNNGGNLAAASDCVRLLPGVIERCGIYSDLDVEINFNCLPSVVNIKSPMIFPATIELNENDFKHLAYNNEFLGFAQDRKNPHKIAPEALNSLRLAQDEIILRYSKPLKALKAPVIRGLHTSVTLNSRLSAIIDWLGNKKISELSIFDIRKLIENITIRDLIASAYHLELENILGSKSISTYSDSQLETCLGKYERQKSMHPDLSTQTNLQIATNILTYTKNALLKASVMEISGPFITIAFFKKELGDFDFYKIVTQNLQEEKEKFVRCIQAASLHANGLADCVIGQDAPPKANKPISDESWTPQGAKLAKERSDTYLNAILLIQRACRKSLLSKAAMELETSVSKSTRRK